MPGNSDDDHDDADADPSESGNASDPSNPSGPSDPVVALATLDAWHAEGYAARVHYGGAGKQYSIEYYAPSEAVLYWAVDEEGGVAVPVPRETVPEPLRERVREDLAEAGVDPDLERDAL